MPCQTILVFTHVRGLNYFSFKLEKVDRNGLQMPSRDLPQFICNRDDNFNGDSLSLIVYKKAREFRVTVHFDDHRPGCFVVTQAARWVNDHRSFKYLYDPSGKGPGWQHACTWKDPAVKTKRF